MPIEIEIGSRLRLPSGRVVLVRHQHGPRWDCLYDGVQKGVIGEVAFTDTWLRKFAVSAEVYERKDRLRRS